MKTICIAGKNDIAVDVLEYCIQTYPYHRIVCILNRNERGTNSWQKSLEWFAEKNGVSVCSLEEMYEIEDLIFLSTEFDRIVNPNKFISKNLYNIHFSLLPKYKGVYTSVLPVLYGDKTTGVTFHKIRRGIDTGEIIDQEEFDISIDDTSYDIYKRLISVGTKVILRNINNVINGNVTYRQQPIEDSTYFGPTTIDYENLRLDIRRTAFQVQNQIRAFFFRPYQVLKWENQAYVHCEILNYVSDNPPGYIIEDNELYTIVSTIDYDVKLYKDVFEELLLSIKEGNDTKAKKYCTCNEIINSKDSHGWSALSVAVYNDNFDMVKYLLGVNADIHTKNNNGTTLLMYAKDVGLRTGNWDIFRFLIHHGLDALETDYSGKRILDYMEERKMMEMPADILSIIRGSTK